jgi:ABC-type multidrug transport system ATPase subunit
MTSPTGPRLRFDSFGKRFGLRTILKSASAWAWPGRITLLMGRNGCGKTTILRCGLGLTWAEFGVVLLEGRRVSGGLPEMSQAGVAFLPDRRLLSPRLTLREHLAAFEQARHEVMDPGPASSLDVEDLLDSRPSRMSGGEQRRAEIWLTVMTGTSCLIADEPFVGIAPADRSRVAAALRSRADAGAAILVTGHEVEDLFDLADEVIWMVAGTTHGLGTPEEAARHAQFRLEYLGTRSLPQ